MKMDGPHPEGGYLVVDGITIDAWWVYLRNLSRDERNKQLAKIQTLAIAGLEVRKTLEAYEKIIGVMAKRLGGTVIIPTNVHAEMGSILLSIDQDDASGDITIETIQVR